ncbi:MAG: DUF5667 domain-containing protein [Actinomycetota bacterium]
MGTRSLRNDLDRLLDGLTAGEEPVAKGDLAPLLHPARAARATLSRSLPSEVAHDHLVALRTDRASNVVIVPAVRHRGVRMGAISLVTGIALVLGAGSAVAASASALPGDALYGVKRAAERISLAMHREPIGRIALQLRFASIRMSEVEDLIAAGGDPTDAIEGLEDALDGAELDALHAIALGKDSDALLAHVQEMISKHIAVLNDVLARVPDQAKDAIQKAIDNAEKAKANVQQGKENPEGDPGGGPPTTPPGNSGSVPGSQDKGKGKSN